MRLRGAEGKSRASFLWRCVPRRAVVKYSSFYRTAESRPGRGEGVRDMENTDAEARRPLLLELMDHKKLKALQLELEDMNSFDVADFLSELGRADPKRMAAVFRLLSKEMGAEVFAELDAPEQEAVINSVTDRELAAIVGQLYVDDAVDMMGELPANVVKRVMRTATPETRDLINQYLKYP